MNDHRPSLYILSLLSAIFLVGCSPSVGTTNPVYERALASGIDVPRDDALEIELLADVICESRDRGLSHIRMQDYLLGSTKRDWSLSESYIFLRIVYEEKCPEYIQTSQEKHAL